MLVRQSQPLRCAVWPDRLSLFHMPKLGLTRDQLHKKVYRLGLLATSEQRQAVEACLADLSRRDKWTPAQLRIALKELEEQKEISKEKRYQLQKELFPDHAW